ncbi:MAG: ATPase [Terricaulis sp.]
MRFFLMIAALAFAGLDAAPAQAEIAAVAPGAFLIQTEAELAASPEQTWRALTRIGRWWGSEHTYSGDAGRLSLDPRAGGCWCERWSGQSVEHARVVLAMERDGVRTLRTIGGLGPLQEMGTTAILTFVITPQGSGSKISMTYRVAGDPGLGLGPIAPLVDQVLMAQFARLVRYAGTGSPD